MITKWRTSPYNTGKVLIERIECTKETDHSVWHYQDQRWGRSLPCLIRVTKRTTVSIYHDSWQEAYDHLLETVDNDLLQAERTVQRAQERRAAVLALTSPQEVIAA